MLLYSGGDFGSLDPVGSEDGRKSGLALAAARLGLECAPPHHAAVTAAAAAAAAAARLDSTRLDSISV